MTITRHEFLAALHQRIKPKVYLEIGVQYGSSLILAEAAQVAYGIDPNPLLFGAPQNQLPNQRVYPMTSDEFFEGMFLTEPIDFAFIDGMHLVENVIRDFLNVQKRMTPGGLIVFDDVLPYNDAIAERAEPPGGDWTGDVWKAYYLLQDEFFMNPYLVDTWPTGTMVLLDVDPRPSLLELDLRFLDEWKTDSTVPPWMIERRRAGSGGAIDEIVYDPKEILEML